MSRLAECKVFEQIVASRIRASSVGPECAVDGTVFEM